MYRKIIIKGKLSYQKNQTGFWKRCIPAINLLFSILLSSCNSDNNNIEITGNIPTFEHFFIECNGYRELMSDSVAKKGLGLFVRDTDNKCIPGIKENIPISYNGRWVTENTEQMPSEKKRLIIYSPYNEKLTSTDIPIHADSQDDILYCNYLESDIGTGKTDVILKHAMCRLIVRVDAEIPERIVFDSTCVSASFSLTDGCFMNKHYGKDETFTGELLLIPDRIPNMRIYIYNNVYEYNPPVNTSIGGITYVYTLSLDKNRIICKSIAEVEKWDEYGNIDTEIKK